MFLTPLKHRLCVQLLLLQVMRINKKTELKILDVLHHNFQSTSIYTRKGRYDYFECVIFINYWHIATYLINVTYVSILLNIYCVNIYNQSDI